MSRTSVLVGLATLRRRLMRSARRQDGILVRLGQNTLDHVRMRTWQAIVGLEGRAPKIVETRLLL